MTQIDNLWINVSNTKHHGHDNYDSGMLVFMGVNMVNICSVYISKTGVKLSPY